MQRTARGCSHDPARWFGPDCRATVEGSTWCVAPGAGERVLSLAYFAGWMFWLTRKTFSGS
jgi:hypothetical protein